jgi:hypothetical protein
VVAVRLDVNDCCDLPTSDAIHLSDYLVRFRFQRPREPSQNLGFILESRPIATLFPDAPNRAAVEHNVRELQKALDDAYERERSRMLSYQVLSSRDYALFNIEHHCNPALLYTNGQAVATLVERAERGFEVAFHRELRGFLAFCSEYEIPDFISSDQVRRVGTLLEAELWIRHLLSEIRISMVPMFRGDSSASLALQKVGERRGQHRRETVYSVSFLGESTTVLIGGDHEAYRVLNDLEFDDFRVRACATCRNFRFSGMSRDMSNGSTGYCTLHFGIDPRTERNDLMVSVFSLCPEHDFVDDGDRSQPYLPGPNDHAR